MPATLRRCLRPLAGLTAAYTGLLVFATHYPRPEELLGPNPPSDKTLHVLAYGALGLLATALLAVSGRWSARPIAVLATGLAIFAAIDEATQPWFGRFAEPLDWVYDLVGLAVGIAAIVALNATIRSSRTRPGGRG
ncbi:MAG: VanZ family protein [Planctomycetota bacterium]